MNTSAHFKLLLVNSFSNILETLISSFCLITLRICEICKKFNLRGYPPLYQGYKTTRGIQHKLRGIFTRYSPDIHQIPTKYSPDTHQIFTGYSPVIHQISIIFSLFHLSVYISIYLVLTVSIYVSTSLQTR